MPIIGDWLHECQLSFEENNSTNLKKFNCPNPNTALINELAANGVKFFICGQSLRARKLTDEKRNPNFKVYLSAMLAISTYQLKGFVMVPL